MSNWREQLTEDAESRAVVAWLNEYYHVPVLLFVIGFAFWNRIRNWDNFIVDGEVIPAANDPWYHMRTTEYTVRNFPQTMPFDPWTQFPLGNYAAQFGTLFDQVIAFFALLLGLGSPGQYTTRLVFIVAPAFWVALVCLPAYFVGKRMGGRFGGLITTGFVAFAPDRLLAQGIAGNTTHHTAEALFMAVGLLGVMVALTTAEQEKPVYELVAAGEFDALRRPIGWSMLAGVGMGMYIWVWPPGLWLFGILAVFFVIHMSAEHVRGHSPEHPAFVGVIAIATASLMQFMTLRSFELNSTARSYLQPGLGFAVVAGLVFLAWLSRELDGRDVSRYTYPGAVAGSILLVVGAVFVLLPGIFDFFFGQVDRVLGFITSPGETAGTVGEAQPASQSDMRRWYSWAHWTAFLGALVLLVKQVFGEKNRGEELLVVVWAAFMVAATFTQIRFGYYLTVPLGALNAALVGIVMRLVGSDQQTRLFTVNRFQVMTVLIAVMVIFVPIIGVGPANDEDSADTAMEVADGRSAPGGIVGWKSSLDWMNENTPAEGQYANPDGEPMDLWGQYRLTEDYDYPDGAYGVLSWWDYGHWITGQAERIPVANPFQQGTTTAAEFLLAQDEATAEEVISSVDENENAKTRYVMVDWKMVEAETQRPLSGKFFAPTAFTDKYENRQFYTRLASAGRQGGLQTLSMLHKQPYYQSMVTRLYHFHGSSETVRVPNLGIPVVEWTGTEQELPSGATFVRAPQNGTAVTFVDTMEQARNITENNPSAQIGGIGGMPSERVPALEHYRLVQMSDVNALGRSQASLQANSEHRLPFYQRQFTQRTIVRTGLGVEIARTVSGDQTMTQRDVVREMREGTDLGNRIQLIGESVLFPTTPAWTKVFERVPGGTIQGEGGPANSDVRISVPIQPESGQEFQYTQTVETDENGEFTATVPYATEGYDNWGPENGYTNVSARANGSYTIQALETNESGYRFSYGATANVTEAQVIGEDSSPVEVTLQERVIPPLTAEPGEGNGENGGEGQNGGDEGSSSDGTSDGNESSSIGAPDRTSSVAIPPLRVRP